MLAIVTHFKIAIIPAPSSSELLLQLPTFYPLKAHLLEHRETFSYLKTEFENIEELADILDPEYLP